MRARELLAGAMLAAIAATRAFVWSPLSAGAFRIVLLHGIRANQTESVARLLDYILENGGVLEPSTIADRLKSTTTTNYGRVPFLLSFDDGFASNFAFARPLLNERQIKALFFVCPGLIDLNPDAQRRAVALKMFPSGSSRQTVEPLMTWDELALLRNDGHVIGSHTMSHARLTSLSPGQQADEIGLSAERLSEQMGSQPAWFAYPFGDIRSIDAGSLREISRHFTFCRSTIRGMNGPGTDPWALLADNVNLTHSFSWHRLTLAGGVDFRYSTPRASFAAMAREVSQRAVQPRQAALSERPD